MPLTLPTTKFQVPWASSAGSPYIRIPPVASQIPIQPGAASLSDGFPPLTMTPVPQGGIPPFGQDANGILNLITAWIQWNQAGGAIPYDSVFQAAIGGYPLGAIVSSGTSLGVFWQSTVANNTTNPDAAGAGWVLFSVATFDTFALAQAASIPAGNNILTTRGYTVAGDAGAATYKRTTGTNFQLTTADGAHWLLEAPSLTIEMFGGVADNGVTDNATPLGNALAFANGAQVNLGIGTYAIKHSVSSIVSTLFAPGVNIRGAGVATILDNQIVGGNPMLSVGGLPNLFSLGGYIKGLKIITSTHSPVTGVDIRAAYQLTVEDIHIFGLTNNGLTITNTANDSDASSMVTFRRCRFENCGTGTLCNFTGTSVQTSFLRFDECFWVSNTGTAGLYLLGLQHTIVNCAFATNTGPGLFIANPPGGANNAQITMIGTSFEDNGTNQVRIDSLEGGVFIDTEIASPSALFPCTVGMGIGSNGGSGLVSALHIDGTRVRIASSGFNPYTMYNIGANANLINITNTFWASFDSAGETGHTRYSINPAASYGCRVSDSFNALQEGDDGGTTSVNCSSGTTHNQALPLDGAEFGITGPSGSFSLGGFTNPWPGRMLFLINNSGQVLTLLAEDSSNPVAANRIHTDGLSNVTVNNAGAALLVYSGTLSRWFLFGHG